MLVLYDSHKNQYIISPIILALRWIEWFGFPLDFASGRMCVSVRKWIRTSHRPHFGIELPFFSINRKRGMEYPVKASSPLRVELLEDRCVPAVLPPTTFVIDPALIHPNSPPVQAAPPATVTAPVIIYMPIAGPFMP